MIKKSVKFLNLILFVTFIGLSVVFFSLNDLNAAESDNEIVKPPKFNIASGFYNQPVSLEISANDGDLIFYTLDGSDPNTNSNLYQEAIILRNRSNEENVLAAYKAIKPVENNPAWSTVAGSDSNFINTFAPTIEAVPKSTIIRAIAVDKNGNKSSIVTNSYFIGLNTNSKYNSLPIISLVTDPHNLFDYEKGIYCLGKVFDDFRAVNNLVSLKNAWSWPANYTNSGKEFERPAHIQMFENDGSVAFSQGVGIRIHGGASRSYLQKSFKVYPREEYDDQGRNKINYPIFTDLNKKSDPTEKVNEFDNIILRNGGNDCDFTKFRDSFIQTLVNDRSFSTQASRPCIVFLDGEYWGVYIISEKYDSDYIKTHYNVKKNNIILVKNNEIEDGTEEDMKSYTNMINFAQKNDLANNENFSKICNMIDLENFIDYYASQIYINNSDWPNKNFAAWRVRETSTKDYEDGKWRWMMFDTEFSMGLYSNGSGAETNSINNAARRDPLFNNLLKNAKFKEQFANTLFDLTNVNFESTRISTLLTKMNDVYRPVMGDYYKRFIPPADKLNLENTFDVYSNNIKKYLTTRQTSILNITKSALALKGSKANVSLESNLNKKDLLKINTVTPDMSYGFWSGYYFTDYEITLQAKEIEGYSFKGWELSGCTSDDTTKTNINIKLNSNNVSIKAIYTPSRDE